MKRLWLPLFCAATTLLHAAPPPPLPGLDVTGEINRLQVPADSVTARTPALVRESPTWLDRAMSSWEAPSLAEQMAEDVTAIPMGLGGIFVPRMTESTLEPEVDILDSAGELTTRGRTGTTWPVLPGTYFVLIGSGTHQQAMVRTVTVEESRVNPVIPDWGGLSVEVVNEDNIPFRGEFELARIDRFDPYGRRFGPDVDLGERAETWLLPPGIYKLFSVGDGYNTLRNFITVQLLPGQLTRLLLILDEDQLRVVGGGIVDVGLDRTLTRHWKYGIDLGGGALFNAVNDRLDNTEQVTTNTLITLLLNTWIRYDRNPFDWYSSLRLDEGLSLRFDRATLSENLLKSVDDARLRSLYIWRMLPWAGPYGRFEIKTRLFPTSEARNERTESHFFIVNDTGSPPRIDSALTLQVEPFLSPFDLVTGVGANIDIFSSRTLEGKLRTGFGYSFSSIRDKSRTLARSDLDSAIVAALPDTTYLRGARIIEEQGSDRIHEAGPELGINLDLRLGRLAVLKTEVMIFAPLAPEIRFLRPDFFFETSLNWRLARAVTLDYRYNYALKQPDAPELREDRSVHRVQLRYSFSSR